MNNPITYPESYYAATRNKEIKYPALTSELRTDVCVIGAGFSGLATALFLCERGKDVVVLEANRVGWGASGRNGGHVVSGYGEGTADIIARHHGPEAGKRADQLGFECIDILKETIDRHEIDCDLAWGYLRAAVTNRQTRHIKDIHTYLQDRHPEAEPQLEEADNTRSLINSTLYKSALYTKNEGHLHPLNLALGEATAVQKLGGHIYENSPASALHMGETVTVKTAVGSVEADTLVLCGNAYLEKLEPRLQRTLIPGYSAIIATEPLPEEQRNRLIPLNTAVSDMRTVLDYYRFSADGRMLWGGLPHWSGGDSANPAPTLKKRMITVFPELAEKRIDYTWSGRIGVSANLNPQVGRLASNVYYAQAYSGHGVASTHLSGRMIADAITRHSDDFEMFASLPHMVIPVNDMVHRLARAWGMNSRRIIEWF